MANIKDINNKLKNIVKVSGFDKVVEEADQVAANIKALESTKLGIELNVNISGVQGLTVGAGPANIAILQNNLSGLGDQVIKDVSTSKTALQAITAASDAIENGFVDFVFTSASAEGVKAAIKVVAEPTDAQVKVILSNVVPDKFKEQVDKIVSEDFAKFTTDLEKTVVSFNNTFNNIVNGKIGNVLQDILLQIDTAPISAIVALGVNLQKANEILVLLQNGQLKDAVEIVRALTRLPLTIQAIESALSSIPVDISSQISSTGVKKSALPVFDPTTNFNEWNGKSTPDSFFSIVATLEELMIEMINTSREITEVVFYGYEISEDQTVVPQDIHQACIDAGLDGIAYHYVILPNGDLRRGRALSVDGEHNSTHNQYSIAVVIPHVKDVGATIPQSKTVELFLEAFWSLWPGGQCWDIKNDIDLESFDVGVNIDNFRNNFRKQNFGNAGRSYSTSQLISAAKGNL